MKVNRLAMMEGRRLRKKYPKLTGKQLRPLVEQCAGYVRFAPDPRAARANERGGTK